MVDNQATVFVVDDDDAVRDSLCQLFASVNLASEAFASGEEFLASYQLGRPGCLMVDMRMPGLSAFEVQEALTARTSTLPVIVITGYGDVESGVRAMKAGAVDFIEKPFKEQALLEMVQKTIVWSLAESKRSTALVDIRHDLDCLTPREHEVLDCIVSGEPNKRIAFILSLSEKTVEFHRANVMKKMQARSLADLLQKTLRARAAQWAGSSVPPD